MEMLKCIGTAAVPESADSTLKAAFSSCTLWALQMSILIICLKISAGFMPYSEVYHHSQRLSWFLQALPSNQNCKRAEKREYKSKLLLIVVIPTHLVQLGAKTPWEGIAARTWAFHLDETRGTLPLEIWNTANWGKILIKSRDSSRQRCPLSKTSSFYSDLLARKHGTEQHRSCSFMWKNILPQNKPKGPSQATLTASAHQFVHCPFGLLFSKN